MRTTRWAMVAVAVLSVVVAVAVPGSVQANSSSAARCDVPTLRNKVSAFVRAYNRGDLRQLDRLFSRDRFKWDSSGGAARSNRDVLVRNLDRRYQRGDRLRSVTFRFTGYERQRDLGHFQLKAERRADDILKGVWFPMSGKGAFDCSRLRVTFALMFLGRPR